ncbi:hypothetical protein PoB_003015500 [Plakobranchus ocellatus]|uniref:Uncharacterized protein n=1 Tax=Plakobranchus ocellatus TaxID=259542 RepID=A0AAV4A8G1_9GAST|nr:hypothetical protein PoB_003015500 [Plakobranchus ocellatus]
MHNCGIVCEREVLQSGRHSENNGSLQPKRGPSDLWGRRWHSDSESTLRSAGILLSRVQAAASASWPDGGLESLRSPYSGLTL